MTRLQAALRTVALLLALGLTALPRTSAAQSSLVPAQHPVYDWLEEQRLAGRLPTFDFEVRPMARVVIAGHLRTLAAKDATLSEGERHLLRDFRREFEQDQLEANHGWTPELFRGLPASLLPAIRDRRDPVILARTTADSVVSGALWLAVGDGMLSLQQAGKPLLSGLATYSGVRGYLNTSFGLGFHLDVDKAWTAEHRALIEQLPRYNTNALKPNSTSSYEYESFLSWRSAKYLELAFGRGSQVLGAAITDPLVLRADAPFFGSARLRIGTPTFNLVVMHGALYASALDDTVRYDGGRIAVRVAPERHIVAQRLTWRPTPRLTLAAHEQMVYANRSVDLTYLNPLAPFLLAQARLGDRDNLLVGGDIVYRPIDGTQLLGSILIDDVGVPTQTGTPWNGPYKKAATIGVEQRLLPGLRMGVGYTVTDPWVYGHWLRLNAVENLGQPLGPAMGPNGTELAVRLTTWLPFRTRVMAGVRTIRRGLDPVNAAGVVVKCVGGDVRCGSVIMGQARFAGADVYDIRRMELEAETELIRGLPLVVRLRDDKVTGSGTQLRSTRLLDVHFRFGY